MKIIQSNLIKFPDYNILYYCKHCHKFYTIVEVKKLVTVDKDIHIFKYNLVTDFDDIIYLNENSGQIECPNCKSLNDIGIIIEPWIREMFFKVKGN